MSSNPLPPGAEKIMAANLKRYEKKSSQHTTMFMSTLFIIGIILTIVSWDIDSKLETKKCTSSSLKTSNKIVLCIGVIFMVSSICFYACSTRCNSTITGFHYSFYIFAMLSLGIALIVLGAIISSESSKLECDNTGTPSTIWGLGVVIVIACVMYFYSQYKDKLLK